MRVLFFSMLVFTALACFTLTDSVDAGETAVTAGKKPKKERVVAAVDFDKKKPAYVYSYTLAGYGDSKTNKIVRVNDQLTATHEIAPTAGKDSAGAHAKLDATKLELPEERARDFVGWALGVHYDLREKLLPSKEIGGYKVTFDARVTGTEPLKGTKFTLNFVVADDTIGGADKDKFKDVVLQLGKGEDDGKDCLTLTSEFKSFTFKLEDLKVKVGAPEDLKKYALEGMDFVVQAQGDAEDIGTDADNVLQLDNIKLIKF